MRFAFWKQHFDSHWGHIVNKLEFIKQTIRFIEEEGFLPLRTKYISGDGCVRYVSRNDGTSVTLRDAYKKRTKVYGMRKISVNGGRRVECATDTALPGAICYRADNGANGAIAPLWQLPDTANC